MTIPAWPASLPQVLDTNGYEGGSPDTAIRTPMEVGPGKTRQRISQNVEPVKGTLLLDATELTTLRTFHDDTLFGGTLRFSWVDQISGAAAEYRFTAPPSWGSPSGLLYNVSLELEIMP